MLAPKPTHGERYVYSVHNLSIHSMGCVYSMRLHVESYIEYVKYLGCLGRRQLKGMYVHLGWLTGQNLDLKSTTSRHK